jgi:hypothetical protein
MNTQMGDKAMKRTVRKLTCHVAQESRGLRQAIADLPDGEAQLALEHAALVLRDAVSTIRAARNRIEAALAQEEASNVA